MEFAIIFIDALGRFSFYRYHYYRSKFLAFDNSIRQTPSVRRENSRGDVSPNALVRVTQGPEECAPSCCKLRSAERLRNRGKCPDHVRNEFSSRENRERFVDRSFFRRSRREFRGTRSKSGGRECKSTENGPEKWMNLTMEMFRNVFISFPLATFRTKWRVNTRRKTKLNLHIQSRRCSAIKCHDCDYG